MNARELIRRETGLDLSEAVAARAVAERMAATGQRELADYLRDIAPQELKALIELVVVPESWMFRDADAFAALVRFARERLAARPGRILRMLSLPCAGGEEPYSIAMALQDAGVASAAVMIEAVDLSEASLERARRGRYTRNAFRGGDLSFRERHFTRDGNEYQIGQALRDQVNFRQGNLLAFDSAAHAGRYDVIFCRNLLIYFDEPTAAAAIGKLRELLDDDGLLFAGYAEVPSFCGHGFTPMRAPGAFALQKKRRAEARVPAQATPAPPRWRPAPAAPQPAAPPRIVAQARPALAPSPAAPAALLEQARRLADQGDYAGAAGACHALLKLDAGSADAYFILGMVSECQAKPGVADDYWRKCVYLQPDHYEALCHLALLAEQNGDAVQSAAFRQRAARVYGRRADSAARGHS